MSLWCSSIPNGSHDYARCSSFRPVVDIVTLLLGLGVVLVIGNTIRLEINNRSVEIEVMKLVGGSDGFIRRPFLYLGFWYGLGGALIAALMIAGALALLRSPASALAELYGSDFRLAGLGLGRRACCSAAARCSAGPARVLQPHATCGR
jgi:cell division transport system permease protein